MLKTRFQSIVTYFLNNPIASSINSPISSQKANATGSPGRKSHLHTVLDYFSNSANRPNSTSQLENSEKQLDRDSSLGQFWRSLLIANSDPTVKEQIDRSGQIYWQVYDPVSTQSHRFFLEEDVYQWLEHRYYQ